EGVCESLVLGEEAVLIATDEQQRGDVLSRILQWRVASQRGAGFVVEIGDPEQSGWDGSRGQLSDRRFKIINAVKRNGSREISARVVLDIAFKNDSPAAMLIGMCAASGRQERGHLSARRFADDGDPIRINAESFFISANEANRLPQVFDLILMPVLRRQTVIDREPREAVARQRLEERRHVSDLVTRLPP